MSQVQPTGDVWCKIHGFIPCDGKCEPYIPTLAADPDVIWHATITGHCQSKANSRRLVLNRKTKQPLLVKSKAAEAFKKEMLFQLSQLKARNSEAVLVDWPLFECDLSITCRIFYPSERNDLDPSLVYDCLQLAKIVKNDRQFKEQHTYRFTDKQNPRVEIELRRI